MKRFGGPGQLPVAMIDMWRQKVLIGGPYIDRVPFHPEPHQGVLDQVEAEHVIYERVRSAAWAVADAYVRMRKGGRRG